MINCDKANLSSTVFQEKNQDTDGTIKNNYITAGSHYTI